MESTIADRAEETGADLRRSLRMVMMAWGFGAAWMYLVTGAALTRYGQMLHLPAFGFGLLAALPFAGALVQLPASMFLERYGRHKTVFIVAGMTHRLLWLAIALVPWVLPDAWWWPGFLMLTLASAIMNNVANPVWYTWMANLVPRRIRGRYFSRRHQLGQAVGLGVTLALGAILDWATLQGNEFLLRTLSGLLALSAFLGIMDFVYFLRVPPPRLGGLNPHVSMAQLVHQPLRNRNFLRFLGFVGTLTFGTAFMAPFAWLYLFDVAGMSNSFANLLMVVVPLVVTMLSTPFWGRMIDRLGRKPVLILCGLLILHGGITWIFITREHWVVGYLVILVATFSWPGVELANFNLMLGFSESMEGRRYASAYAALYNVVIAVAGVLSGVFGGVVAEALRDWKGTVLGWPLTYHGVLFILSAFLRFAALFWLRGLEDKRAYRTRESVRYVGSALYENLQQVVLMPARMVVQVGRWTYTLNARGPFRGRRDAK